MAKLTPIALLLLIGMATRSQPFPELRFTQLTERDGLSCDKTTGVAQDSGGVIWISTNNGLNRFDGFGFTHFFADPGNKSTIPANEIESIAADQHNHLWIQTATGICRFNSITHKVDRLDSGGNTPPAFRSFENTSFWFDQHDDAYAATPAGLYHIAGDARYNVVDDSFPVFILQQQPIVHFAELVSDRRGGVWAYAGNHIFRIDPKTLKYQTSFTIPGEAGIQG